ncbi:MAG: ATPase [Lachnospiraceae bacterium]|nr:ATPase [Lachnospiraceae bacterium]
MIRKQLEVMKNELLAQSQILEKKLLAYPEGNLLCAGNGNYVKWYKSSKSAPVYIPKKQRNIAETLAAKKYYSLQLEELSREIAYLNNCLECYNEHEIKSSTLLDESSRYQELLISYFNHFPDEYQQWLNEEYEHNTAYPEYLIHKCLAGHKVRSKSEVIIANALFSSGIPYRYECGLRFDDLQFFPDFTILHPQTLKKFYWEHFGMMDRQEYCDKTFNKLKIYGSHGIIPSVNLITTYETQTHPIDSENIQRLVQEYFLN